MSGPGYDTTSAAARIHAVLDQLDIPRVLPGWTAANGQQKGTAEVTLLGRVGELARRYEVQRQSIEDLHQRVWTLTHRDHEREP